MAQQIRTRTGLTVQEIRTQASGLHFAKESLTDNERKMLALLEGTLDILDDLTPNGYFRGYVSELESYVPTKTMVDEG